jgi:hypothetical protein
VDLIGVLVSLRARHPRNDPAEGNFNVVKRMTTAIENDDAVGRKQTGQLLLIEIGFGDRRVCSQDRTIPVKVPWAEQVLPRQLR